jgi:cleavage and polyadenylation specificity factor subunit 1
LTDKYLDFELEQILPISDDSEEDLKVLSASFAGGYLLILRSDSSIAVFDESSGEIEALDVGENIAKSKWLSACLYKPTSSKADADEAATLAFCLSPEGGLRIYELPNLEQPAYATEGLPYLPTFLSLEFAPRRFAARVRETLTEVLVADIGDATSKTPYLIVSYQRSRSF